MVHGWSMGDGVRGSKCGPLRLRFLTLTLRQAFYALVWLFFDRYTSVYTFPA